MWEIIPKISSALAAIAFLIAVGGWIYRRSLTLRYQALDGLPPEDKLRGLRDLIGATAPDNEPHEVEQRLRVFDRRYQASLTRFKWLIVAGVICFLGALVAIILVSTFAPKLEYRAAGIYLDHAGQPLSRNFKAIVRVAGIDPIIRGGENGVLFFQLPSHIDELESVSIQECGPFRISDRQKWPAKLQNGNLHIIMVRSEAGPPPPTPPEGYVMDRPSDAEAKAPPRVKPDEVRFQYKNLADSDLRLFLYSFSRRADGKHPLAPNSPWLGSWPFPAKEEFEHFQEFANGNGWFALFVSCEDRTSQAGDHVFPLRNKRLDDRNLFNLFEHRTTSLIVTESGDKNRPFEANVTWED
jgi:hypothetical protein